MNILSRFTRKAMEKNPSRTLVTLLGVILSAAMFTAVTTFTVSLWDFLKEGTIARRGDYFVQCDWLSQEEMSSLREDSRITSLASYCALGYLKTAEDRDSPLSTFVLAAADATYFDTMPIRLSQGSYPKNSRELLLNESILSVLQEYGSDVEIGSTVSLTLLRQCSAYPTVETVDREAQPFTGEYTIVGYMDEDVLTVNNGLDTYPILTLADGEEGSPLWYRAFIKTSPRKVWDVIRGPELHDIDVNETLLSLYGQFRYNNFTGIIFWLAVVLCAIIVVGSVSLIYNSFSISLSERTKQFGLLSCIGATKKQLRRAVYAEAMFLALPGIPIGVLFGYGGISLTLFFLRDRLTLIMGGYSVQSKLSGVFSPTALVIGGILALLTLLLSTALPAKRATGISPLEAIRQTQDYRVPKRKKALGHSLFGLPGTLAKSYYRVSKGKYRATLISLVISMVLFLSSTGFTVGLRQTADQAINVENYDFSCTIRQEEANAPAGQDFISQWAYTAQGYYLAQIDDSIRSEEFLRYREELGKFYEQAVSPVGSIQVYYLEDTVFSAYLESARLDPTDYQDPDTPKALVCYKEVSTYAQTDKQGFYNRYTYHYAPFSSTATELILFPDKAPEGLTPFGTHRDHTYSYTVNEKGEVILTLTPYGENAQGHTIADTENALSYKVSWTEQNGQYTASYYPIDPITGSAEESPICTEPAEMRSIALGETIAELPYGIAQYVKETPYYTVLILPLSAASEDIREEGLFCFSATDYHKALAYLQAEFGEDCYTDYRKEEEIARAFVMVADIFSYGFIILISMICIANIFNTLSTNVALRRRDFGMLKSVGFRNRDVGKMLSYECLSYGSKALLWGMPLGLLCNAGIQKIAADSGTQGYIFPTESVIVAGITVFLIVFISMFYAASKLRKDNPIEALRQECI